ncbi:MAG: ATP-dependent DNA ligase [Bacteroidia bacterium]
MQEFAALFNSIDQTNSTNEKVNALVEYFKSANDDDKLWVVAILSHRRPKRAVTTTLLRTWAAEQAEIPLWLFEETYHIVGDLAETIAQLVQCHGSNHNFSLTDIVIILNDLKKATEAEKKQKITELWSLFNASERFVFNKLLTGGFRMGLSQKLMQRAISKAYNIEEELIALRLMGKWDPFKTSFNSLILKGVDGEENKRPYPFYLAYPKEQATKDLGKVNEWIFEFKWDGIRGQLVKRDDSLNVWSRGEELVTEKYPEFESMANNLPNGIVLDGEILAMQEGKSLSFNLLQQRIGRKTISKKQLLEVPVHFMAYDILEIDGVDIRYKPQKERRQYLEKIIQAVNDERLHLSEIIKPDNWEHALELRENARELGTEGLMIKNKMASYRTGRIKGNWWKWKVDPMTIDAVMIYAMRGHGRRANLYTDFTFAVWHDDKLVPFAKAYSGLTDKEMAEVDAFVKKNTIDRFGPVRSVKAELVFELAFEGINKSKRHKSGIAVRFPRIKRWRKDKKANEASTLNDLKGLIS